MDATFCIHIREVKENKYWTSKERDKFANHLDFPPKDIEIKYKAIEAVKNIKKAAKTQGLNYLDNTLNMYNGTVSSIMKNNVHPCYIDAGSSHPRQVFILQHQLPHQA